MLNLNTIKSITDLRNNPGAIADLAREEGPVLIFDRSRPSGVFVSPEQYEDMIDLIDDYLDLQDIKVRRKQIRRKDLVPLEKIEEEYGPK